MVEKKKGEYVRAVTKDQLRVLEEKKVTRLGGSAPKGVLLVKVTDSAFSSPWARTAAASVVRAASSAFIAFKIADILIGLRVPEEEEREGLDITAHGETAYN